MKTATKLNQLFNDTEELLAELDGQHGPEVDELRDRLEKSIQKTRETVAKQRQLARVKVRDVAGSLNDYVREYPWLALATGVLIASTIGILSTSATKRSFDRS